MISKNIMISKKRAQSSSLFLLELIFAILFFSAASALCVRLFVRSHLLGRDAGLLTHAVNECSSIAEICDTSSDIFQAGEFIQKRYPEASLTDNAKGNAVIVVYYDREYSACGEEDGIYTLTASLAESDSSLSADIRMTGPESTDEISSASRPVIYELHTNHHLARRTDHEE